MAVGRILILLCAAVTAAGQGFDVLLRGGQVLDGKGSPEFVADVGITRGRIQAVGRLRGRTARRVIDAAGKFIAPGFIDLHSHSDWDLQQPDGSDGRLNVNMVAQGVTLSVVNQDGRSTIWPPRRQGELYQKQGTGNNVILLVGHGTLRTTVMGSREAQRVTSRDLEAMKTLIDQAMKEGAWGISAGLEYSPGLHSDTHEITELVRVLRPFHGVFISHQRSEGREPLWKTASDKAKGIDLLGAVAETIHVGRETGVKVVCSHIKAKGADCWGSSSAVIELIRQARNQGVQVYADQYPYDTSATDGNTVLMPLWAIAAPGQRIAGQLDTDLRPAAFRAAKANLGERLRDRQLAARIRTDIESEILRRGGPDRIVVEKFPDRKYANMTLALVARERDLSPVDAVIWLQMSGWEGVPGGARLRGFSLSEQDITSFMKQDFTAVSTDGSARIPHPRSWGAYVRRIERYVVKQKVTSLPFAIRAMTGLPARILGLRDRGLVAEGYWADLVVFDPAELTERGTASRPDQAPGGILHVLVNGVAVIDGGRPTGKTPGKVLLRTTSGGPNQ